MRHTGNKAYFSGDSFNLGKIVVQHYGDPEKYMVGAEIGVHIGCLSSHMLRMFPNLRLFMVDPWLSLTHDQRYIESQDEIGKHDDKDQEECMLEALEATNFAKGRRIVTRLTSLQAAAACATSLDWVFLDGCHHYDSVKEDIEAWWPHIRVGGFLSGHDYTHYLNDSGKFGVRAAVNEFAAKTPYAFQLKGSCWWMVKHA